MPVEIRELIIKTVITSSGNNFSEREEKELKSLKKQMLEECRRMITEKTKRGIYKR